MQKDNDSRDRMHLNYLQFLMDYPTINTWATEPSDSQINLADLDITRATKHDVVELLMYYEYALAIALCGLTAEEVDKSSAHVDALLQRYTGLVSKLEDIRLTKERKDAMKRLDHIRNHLALLDKPS